jgi:hypothetical protein
MLVVNVLRRGVGVFVYLSAMQHFAFLKQAALRRQRRHEYVTSTSRHT